jgi:hypothetical protein
MPSGPKLKGYESVFEPVSPSVSPPAHINFRPRILSRRTLRGAREFSYHGLHVVPSPLFTKPTLHIAPTAASRFDPFAAMTNSETMLKLRDALVEIELLGEKFLSTRAKVLSLLALPPLVRTRQSDSARR